MAVQCARACREHLACDVHIVGASRGRHGRVHVTPDCLVLQTECAYHSVVYVREGTIRWLWSAASSCAHNTVKRTVGACSYWLSAPTVCLPAPTGVQPHLPWRVPEALGRHILPRVPLLHVQQQQQQHLALRSVRHYQQPVDMPHLRPCGVRALQVGACQPPLAAEQPLLCFGVGDAAGVGLCRWVSSSLLRRCGVGCL